MVVLGAINCEENLQISANYYIIHTITLIGGIIYGT